MQSPEYPDLAWVEPRSWTVGRMHGPPRFITIHYTAGAEGPGTAMNGALFDAKRTDGTSTHYFVDSTQVVQCVKTVDTAHTALRHGNWWGIHYEQTGTAQTRAQWLDPVSRATIRNTARQAARDMTRWKIPLVRVQGRGVRDLDARGVCGHVDWTVGWPEDGGDHTDPGPEYPWDALFADLAEFLGGPMADSQLVVNGMYRLSCLALGDEVMPKGVGNDNAGEVQWDVKQLKKLDAIAADAHTAATRDNVVNLSAEQLAVLADTVISAMEKMVERAVAKVSRKGTDSIQQ